ncbi:MAG: C4-type zinc ribbon domain-containing protein [Prevotellaceae bacterium]|nr:C4-type zinc ribbon domain-containing protein [Prevotellaceae bacterium]
MTDNDTPEAKLRILFQMQQADSQADQLRLLRGELPLEVRDLEDEIHGLKTRISNLQADVKAIDSNITKKKIDIETATEAVKRYGEQQKNVKNNREYDSLSKEIEYQNLEIELANKRVREYSEQMRERKTMLDETKKRMTERSEDLEIKKRELDEIIAETAKDEKELEKKSAALQALLDPRMLTAYLKVRKNARNGLAVVKVQRDACGGCFNKIPPQRQLDIILCKKIIVCEYCGRILVDSSFEEM